METCRQWLECHGNRELSGLQGIIGFSTDHIDLRPFEISRVDQSGGDWEFEQLCPGGGGERDVVEAVGAQ